MNNVVTYNDPLIKRIDWSILTLFILLSLVGWINIYSTESTIDSSNLSFNLSLSYTKQIINFGISLFIGFCILFISEKIYKPFGYTLYFIAIILGLATLLFGKTINGAKGWIDLGFFDFQTVELLKLATIIALAKFLDNFEIGLNGVKEILTSVLILILPIIIVLLENDTGSALVFLALFLVLYRKGLNGLFLLIPVILIVVVLSVLLFDKFIIISVTISLAFLFWFFTRNYFSSLPLILLVTIGIIALVFLTELGYSNLLKGYQKDRIEVLLGKKMDIKGAGYNVHQSLIAIGSGGFLGKGFLNGTQTKYNFVPEQTTDFIFCTIGEEWGLIGSGLVIVLYGLLFIRIISVTEKQQYDFNKYFGYGLFSVLFIHFLINIAMTLGLFPVVGIPLPFLSYGGSSYLIFTVMIFIFLKLDAETKIR